MAESEVRSIFGVHDIRFLSRDDWSSVAYYKVLGNVEVSFSAEMAELRGGSNLFPWAQAVAKFASEVTITGRQISSDIVGTNLGASVTEYSADSAGDVILESNVKGTSVSDAAEGIASITVTPSTGAAELKEGWYMVKAASASTVNVYAISGANFSRGTNEVFEDDDGLITASPLTVGASGGTVTVDNFGLTITGGSSSAIAMTTNDTMRFYVQKPHGGAFKATIGEVPLSFPEYACIITSEDDGGVIHTLTLWRAKPAGMSLPFSEKAYGEFNVSMGLMYDSSEGSVGLFEQTTPES